MRKARQGAWNVRPQKVRLNVGQRKTGRTQEDSSAEGQNGLQKWGENLSAGRLVWGEADTRGGQGFSVEDCLPTMGLWHHWLATFRLLSKGR